MTATVPSDTRGLLLPGPEHPKHGGSRLTTQGQVFGVRS